MHIYNMLVIDYDIPAKYQMDNLKAPAGGDFTKYRLLPLLNMYSGRKLATKQSMVTI